MIGKAATILAVGAVGALTMVRVADDRYVDDIRRGLEKQPTSGRTFSEEMVADLPDPAQRYFLHAIKQGTPLATKLYWNWSGQMKPAREMPWMDLTSEQISVKERGFVWKARAGKGPLILTAADHYKDGEGRMRISLFGLVPIVNASGPDLSKASLGRVVVESMFMPSSLLPGPHVQIDGVNESHFEVTVGLYGEKSTITLTVDQEGRVREYVIGRWGNLTDDGSYRYIPYGGIVEEERTFGGYTIPSRAVVGWWYGTEQYLEVIRLRVDEARFE